MTTQYVPGTTSRRVRRPQTNQYLRNGENDTSSTKRQVVRETSHIALNLNTSPMANKPSIIYHSAPLNRRSAAPRTTSSAQSLVVLMARCQAAAVGIFGLACLVGQAQAFVTSPVLAVKTFSSSSSRKVSTGVFLSSWACSMHESCTGL